MNGPLLLPYTFILFILTAVPTPQREIITYKNGKEFIRVFLQQTAAKKFKQENNRYFKQ